MIDTKRKNNLFLVRFKVGKSVNGNKHFTLTDMTSKKRCTVNQDYSGDMLQHFEAILDICPCVKSYHMALANDDLCYFAAIECDENYLIEECKEYYC